MSEAPALSPRLDTIRFDAIRLDAILLDLGGQRSPLAAIRTAAHAAVLRHRARRAVHESLTPAAYRREVTRTEPDR